MRHPLRWFLVGFLVVVVAVVGAGAWYVFGSSSPAKPALSGSDPTVTVAPGAKPDGTWTVARAKDVYVGYRIKELFGGNTLKRDAVGRTSQVTGTMAITDTSVRSATVTANVATLTSDRDARDQYIHRHALDSDAYPRATFALTAPIALPAHVRPGVKIHEAATGNLTLHGVTRPVTLSVDARWNGATIEVAGTAPVQLRDYGIEPPHTPIVSVDDHGSLELHLVFART